ncbi:MAG: DNA-3-methyladenine glycosylase [Myxococcales bacterium]|nr:DNA-3-methyladenine glycosylase [Myxococcales bacterium]
MSILPQEFCAGATVDVAQALLGKCLQHGRVRLRITEVEAYPPGDSASHCRSGKTSRNAPMWGPPGCAYVYLCYGIHQMLNIVTEPAGEGAAVLIRSCEPVTGEVVVRRRRGGRTGPVLLTGPGKVGAALAVDTRMSGARLYLRGGLMLVEGPPPAAILCGPRVGIDYADPDHVVAPLRFACADTPWVSHRRSLLPKLAG